jgi:hypothetical protein
MAKSLMRQIPKRWCRNDTDTIGVYASQSTAEEGILSICVQAYYVVHISYWGTP